MTGQDNGQPVDFPVATPYVAGTGSPPDTRVVRVDLDELRGLVDLLRVETEANFHPNAGSAITGQASGPTFGAHYAGGSMHATRQAYADSVSQFNTNITAYLSASRILVAAVEAIAHHYKATDSAAEGTVQSFKDTLTNATNQQRAANALRPVSRPTDGSGAVPR
jgi:hypothetical protein